MKHFGRILLRLSLILFVSASVVGCSGDGGTTEALEDVGGPVVRGVLFYAPSCQHCHEVMTEVIPPLEEEYGDQLLIMEVDASTSEGGALYQAAVERFAIQNRGVPTLIVGEEVLIGSIQIPERLPGIIEDGLETGGIDWPDIPGLAPPQ